MSPPRSSSLWRTIQAPCDLKRSVTFSGSYWSGGPTLNLLGGSERTFGYKKRSVPRSQPIMVAVKATQAMPHQVQNMTNRKPRRSLPALTGALAGAAGLAGPGLAGAGAPVILVVSAIASYPP